MARTLAQILQEANSIIEKRASVQPESPKSVAAEDDEVQKLAAEIMAAPTPSPAVSGEIVLTEAEKYAHSVAILETVLSADDFKKFQDFEKEASTRGFSEAQINEAMEKMASKGKGVSKAGRRVADFMEGFGESLQKHVNAAPKVTSKSIPARSSGEIAGYAAPLVAALGVGSYGGSKLKEREIQKRYGVS